MAYAVRRRRPAARGGKGVQYLDGALHGSGDRSSSRPCRDDPAHATARVRAVAVISSDQMDMQVADSLTGCGAIGDADVEAGRSELGQKLRLHRIKQCQHRFAFSLRGIEERGHVPQGDHE